MLYNVLFFALPAEKFAKQMQRSPEKLLAKVQFRVRRELKSNPEVGGPILDAAEAICRGEVPAKAPQPYFDAFYALVSGAGERIALGCLHDFRHSLDFELTGIWPWTQQEKPPFVMPRGKQELPQFGFMSAGFMRGVVLPGLALLPPCPDGEPLRSWCRLARNQFREVVESVSADGLDLVATYSVW